MEALSNRRIFLFLSIIVGGTELTSLAALTSPDVCQIARSIFSVDMLAPICFWSLIQELVVSVPVLTARPTPWFR